MVKNPVIRDNILVIYITDNGVELDKINGTISQGKNGPQ
jgi:hypothetical protein